MLSSLAVVAAVWGGYHLFTVHQAARAMRDLLATSDVNGFVEVLPPANVDGWRHRRVHPAFAVAGLMVIAANQVTHIAQTLTP